MRIKDLPAVDRPREKLQKYGPEKLSDAELVAILLGTGRKGANAVELGRAILHSHAPLSEAGLAGLAAVPGLGIARASRIVACMELGRRLLLGKKASLVLSPEDVWRELADLRDRRKEHFVMFFLDARNQKISREVISVGTLTMSVVHPREVFEPAIARSAAQIILAHNHPSGDASPSQEDVRITSQLVQAGRILGIEVVDHVVVSSAGYRSMKACGLLV